MVPDTGQSSQPAIYELRVEMTQPACSTAASGQIPKVDFIAACTALAGTACHLLTDVTIRYQSDEQCLEARRLVSTSNFKEEVFEVTIDDEIEEDDDVAWECILLWPIP